MMYRVQMIRRQLAVVVDFSSSIDIPLIYSVDSNRLLKIFTMKLFEKACVMNAWEGTLDHCNILSDCATADTKHR